MTATADIELAFAGPGALAGRVRAGEIHPRELVELFLRRIESLDPRLNAFRVVRAERALAEAESVARGGALAGVPIAIKDDTALAGEATTRGSRSAGPPAAEDAEVVRRLRGAGAIPIGVTNVPELMIFPWTATEANGVTRNPWDPSRTPGGSSGGSAAAVASGMVPAATASDGGGSIRIPSACCGLVGMKPTYGRVPSGGGGGWLGLSTRGALARTVADSALLLDVMHGGAGGPDAPPPFTGRYVDAVARYETQPARLRIAVSRKLLPGSIGGVSSDQRRAWDGMAGLLSGLGHEVAPRDPDYGLVGVEFIQLWMRGVYEDSLTVPDRSLLEPTTRQMAAGGRYLVPPARRRALLAQRAATTARIAALWNDFDVLMTPGLATTAIAAEGASGRPAPIAINTSARFSPFTSPFNVTGQPAVTVPAGMGGDGLPLSVQLVGRHGAEDVLYALAGQLEAAEPWAGRRPAIA